MKLPFFNGPYRNPFRNAYNFFRYNIPQGLRNLIVYAPVIWHTREWDQAYLYELMSFKLRRMERVLRFGIATDRKKTADQIKLVIPALERLYKDDYIVNNPQHDAWKRQEKDLKIVTNGIMQSPGWWE